MMSVQTGKPRVSVGIRVYNGEDFLSFALDSVLAQTFRDFELLICDNAPPTGLRRSVWRMPAGRRAFVISAMRRILESR